MGEDKTAESSVGSLTRYANPILRELEILWGAMKKSPFSVVGFIILFFYAGIALLAPILAPPEPGTDPFVLKIRDDWKGEHGLGFVPPPTPPSADHPFGTLEGYDIYYACIWGTRTAFNVGLNVTFFTVIIGLFIGCLAGYFGGLLDEFLMRFTDLFFGLPNLFFAILLIVVTSPRAIGDVPLSLYAALRLNSIVIALIVTGWPTYARLIRGEVVKIKNENYVEAAKAAGCSHFRILVRHILPNAISPTIAMASLNVGGVILLESTLSFLGIGIPSGYAAWAPLIASSRHYIISVSSEYAYTFLVPGVFLIFFILGWTLLGDTLRDMQDPRKRRI
jgi:peptide/nickel transport system permease protein